MISVIVPVYKVEKYLKDTVNSILKQTYRNFEVILVDDGSPDKCGQICDELSLMDSRIRVIHQENKGQASARNIGIKCAKGSYVTFVDGDDTIEPDTFEILHNMIISEKCDIAICGFRIVYDNKKIKNNTHNKQKCKPEYLNNEQLLNEIFVNLNNAVWNKIYKTELLKDINFQTDLVHGEDMFFNLEYLLKCKSGVINRTICYNYLKRADSITTSVFSKKRLMEIESKDRILCFINKYYPSVSICAKKFCFRARMNIIRAIIKSNNENEYCQIIDSCKKYVIKNYKNVKSTLKIKEKIEYWLLKFSFNFYKQLIKYKL